MWLHLAVNMGNCKSCCLAVLKETSEENAISTFNMITTDCPRHWCIALFQTKPPITKLPAGTNSVCPFSICLRVGRGRRNTAAQFGCAKLAAKVLSGEMSLLNPFFLIYRKHRRCQQTRWQGSGSRRCQCWILSCSFCKSATTAQAQWLGTGYFRAALCSFKSQPQSH